MLSVIYAECHKQTHYADVVAPRLRASTMQLFYRCEYLISVYTSILPLPIPSSFQPQDKQAILRAPLGTPLE